MEDNFNDDDDHFVQEDPEGSSAEEDALEVKISEEHEKFKLAKAEWQEKVRAARAWSAPTLGSPRPSEQRQRELQQMSAHGANTEEAMAVQRTEYMPPERPFLAKAAECGVTGLSYMAPARPMSADRSSRMQRMSGMAGMSKSGILQNIMEDSPLDDKFMASDAASTPKGEAMDDVASTAASDSAAASENAADDAEVSSGTHVQSSIQSEEELGDGAACGTLESAVGEGMAEVQTTASNNQLPATEHRAAVSDLEDLELAEKQADQGQVALPPMAEWTSASLAVGTSTSKPAAISAAFIRATPLEPEHPPPVVIPTTFTLSPEVDPGALALEEIVEPMEEPVSEASTDFGEMLHPHAFALQLLAHDLRTLPVQQQSSAEQPRQAPQNQPALAQYGYLGLQGLPSPAGYGMSGMRGTNKALAAKARPATAPSKRASLPDTLRRPDTITAAGGGSQSRVMSAAAQRPLGSTSVEGTDMALIASRQLRTTPSMRDAMVDTSSLLLSGAAASQPWEGAKGSKPPAAGVWNTAQDMAAGRRISQRPHTSQRPSSARPAPRFWAGSLQGIANNVPRRRPQSAYPTTGPHKMSWEGISSHDASRGTALGYSQQANQLNCMVTTAAVDVEGVSISVYVADTLRRIAQANQWLAALGSNSRYGLQDPKSNMHVHLLSLEPVISSEGGVAVRVVKTMPLARFMSALKQIKAQVQRQGGGRELQKQRRRTEDQKSPGDSTPYGRGSAGGAGGYYQQARGMPGVLPRQGWDAQCSAVHQELYGAVPMGAEGEHAKEVQMHMLAAAQRCQEHAEEVAELRYLAAQSRC